MSPTATAKSPTTHNRPRISLPPVSDCKSCSAGGALAHHPEIARRVQARGDVRKLDADLRLRQQLHGGQRGSARLAAGVVVALQPVRSRAEIGLEAGLVARQ